MKNTVFTGAGTAIITPLNESGIDYVTVQTTFNILYDKEVIKPRAYCVYEIDYAKLTEYMEQK